MFFPNSSSFLRGLNVLVEFENNPVVKIPLRKLKTNISFHLGRIEKNGKKLFCLTPDTYE